MRVFFSPDDYDVYSRLLAEQASRYSLVIWAYCLMPNHVHLIAVPSSPTGLARPLGEAHRRYAALVNRRQGWAGHLWQERFASFPMDERHLMAAVRYVLLNPVRSGLVDRALDWPHSSAGAHILGKHDRITATGPLHQRIYDWEEFLSSAGPEEDTLRCRLHSKIGRPLGSNSFIATLESMTGRRLRPRKAGRRPTKK
jgi:putative transposase